MPGATRAAYDAEHVAWREGLISVAVAMADARCPEPAEVSSDEHREWTWTWDAAFLGIMNQLASDPFRSSNARTVH